MSIQCEVKMGTSPMDKYKAHEITAETGVYGVVGSSQMRFVTIDAPNGVTLYVKEDGCVSRFLPEYWTMHEFFKLDEKLCLTFK